MRACMSPPRVEFLFSPILWNSCNQTTLTIKTRLSGGFSSYCWAPVRVSLVWGSAVSFLWENFLGMIFPSLWVAHLVDFILLKLLPSCCGFFVLGCGISSSTCFCCCWWLYSSKLWVWCFHKKYWAHVLLLHHVSVSPKYFTKILFIILRFLAPLRPCTCGKCLIHSSIPNSAA